MRARIACLVLTLGIAAPSMAQAPRRGETSVEVRARELFDSARSAIEDGRFAQARELLRRSLELFPNAATAFNLGVALRGTGQARESVRVFEDLLADRYGALSAEQRAQAEALRVEVRAEIAHLSVRARGAPRIDVRIDGQPVGTIEDEVPLDTPVDAGQRVVSAHAPGLQIVERVIAIAPGERASIDLLLDVPIAVPTAGGSIADEPAFWLVLGGSVLAIAGGVVAAVLLTRDDGRVRDDVFGNTDVLIEWP